MTLNGRRARVRKRITDELVSEMTGWSPAERVRLFRSWMRGSLSLIHLHVLTTLEADGPLSMGRLADALDVSVASATGIVDRMEQRGLVERRATATDRRVLEVHPTEAGIEVFRDLGSDRRARLETVLARLTERELISLLIGLRALHKARAAMAAEEQAGACHERAAARGTRAVPVPRPLVANGG
jgi:DNA-binding MarR family transcriptional regulator